jgi:hypothetical protein
VATGHGRAGGVSKLMETSGSLQSIALGGVVGNRRVSARDGLDGVRTMRNGALRGWRKMANGLH